MMIDWYFRPTVLVWSRVPRGNGHSHDIVCDRSFEVSLFENVLKSGEILLEKRVES